MLGQACCYYKREEIFCREEGKHVFEESRPDGNTTRADQYKSNQPRKLFEDKELLELSDSIKEFVLFNRLL